MITGAERRRTSSAEVALLRIVAQRLAGPKAPDPASAVRELTAVQAQDYRGALTSVALRTERGSGTAVEESLTAGEMVRSWPMRGTLHFVAAEDLCWLLDLTTPRPLAGAARRRAQLGLDDTTIARAGDLAQQALSGGGRLRRAELLAAWERGGISTGGQRGYHLLAHLASTGTLCLGPVKDGEQLVVLVAEWVGPSRRLERDQALGELAARYFRGHGPATLQDLARWGGLTLRDARTGLALARPLLEAVDVDGAEHFLDPQTPRRLAGCRTQARAVLLLPGFDELLLGYGDRSAVLPRQFADRIVPGGNGMFRPTVVHNGRVIGTWRTVGRGAGRAVEATPFTEFSPRVAAAIQRRHAELA